MSTTDLPPVTATGEGSTPIGTFDAEGNYVPREVILDDLDGLSFADAIDGTIVSFEDGDIVSGVVVKVDKDEVLLDIGFKSEGVIPARELSIRHDVHDRTAYADGVLAAVRKVYGVRGEVIESLGDVLN
jgi:hypothetical protein